MEHSVEQETFDHLSRRLAGGLSRRRLAALAGLGVGSLTSRSIAVEAKRHKKKHKKKKKPTTCETPNAICGNECVALTSNANCGQCGKVCPAGTSCINGQCSGCGGGETQCGASCCKRGQRCLPEFGQCSTCGGPNELCCDGGVCAPGLICAAVFCLQVT
jgi:hypothetical protein